MRHKAGLYEKYIKRLLDIVLSGCALIVLSPLLLVTAILVRVKLGSPVIFCQERPGKNEKIFKLHKFRSMSDARDETGALLPDEERLTGFGNSEHRRAARAVGYLPRQDEHRGAKTAAGRILAILH